MTVFGKYKDRKKEKEKKKRWRKPNRNGTARPTRKH